MRIPTKPAADEPKLDALAAAVRHEAGVDDTDPVDDALVSAVAGLAEAMKADAAELEAVRGRMVRLARQVPR